MGPPKLPTATVLPVTEDNDDLAVGVYAPPPPNALRSPCPMINSLANHGYIPRSGRNVHALDFQNAMTEIVGLSTPCAALLSNPIFLEHINPSTPSPAAKPSFLGRLWTILRNPWELMPHKIGMWIASNAQIDATTGKRFLNLDQLALHGAVEHDISLTRRDAHQSQGGLHPQKDLIDALLASSTDGQYLTLADLCALRRRRIETQRRENPDVQYGKLEHEIACGEAALVVKVFGDGTRVEVSRVRALFEEERLPIREGWKRRSRWWSIGLVELKMCTMRFQRRIGNVF